MNMNPGESRECLKCFLQFPSEIEFQKHLLLHIQFYSPRIVLGRIKTEMESPEPESNAGHTHSTHWDSFASDSRVPKESEKIRSCSGTISKTPVTEPEASEPKEELRPGAADTLQNGSNVENDEIEMKNSDESKSQLNLAKTESSDSAELSSDSKKAVTKLEPADSPEPSKSDEQLSSSPSISVRSFADLKATSDYKLLSTNALGSEVTFNGPETRPNPIMAPVQRLEAQVDRLPKVFAPVQTPSQAQPHEQYLPANLGNQVLLRPVTPKLRNLPPGIEVKKRPSGPPPDQSPLQQALITKKIRRDDKIAKLPDSITLVRGGVPVAPPQQSSHVTDMLATRGITVVPSKVSAPQSQSVSLPSPNSPAVGKRPINRVNHQLSITPPRGQAPPQQQARRGFLPTVDLTKEEAIRRPPPNRRIMCHICDKIFQTNEILQNHLRTAHGQLPQSPQRCFQCPVCKAVYPSQSQLDHHKVTANHGYNPRATSQPLAEMAIPIVDINSPEVKGKLLQIGIRHAIPLSALHGRSANNTFALPIVPIDLANNPAYSSLEDMGASNLLPMGQLQPLRR